jgi:cyclopropane fatty-acyl-phospholipid synthase-like methyltransferase
LEIGPGLGCIKEYIETNYNIDNYYAIDVCKHFDFERLYKCDGKSIPIDMEFDIIYSHNVFQHLSKKQRLGYFRDVKRVLKDDGEFTFSLFVRTENNKQFFNTKRTNGAYLSLFYNQFIEIPTVDDIFYEVRSNGLKISLEKEVNNICVFKVTK